MLLMLPLVPVKNENGTISVDTSTRDKHTDLIGEEKVHLIQDDDYLCGMMDRKLINEYQINPENFKLKFSLQPTEAVLQHIFAVPVPGLTRAIVENDPYLRGAIYRLHTAYYENGFDEHYFDLLTDFAKHGPDKRTIIADAVITAQDLYTTLWRHAQEVLTG